MNSRAAERDVKRENNEIGREKGGLPVNGRARKMRERGSRVEDWTKTEVTSSNFARFNSVLPLSLSLRRFSVHRFIAKKALEIFFCAPTLLLLIFRSNYIGPSTWIRLLLSLPPLPSPFLSFSLSLSFSLCLWLTNRKTSRPLNEFLSVRAPWEGLFRSLNFFKYKASRPCSPQLAEKFIKESARDCDCRDYRKNRLCSEKREFELIGLWVRFCVLINGGWFVLCVFFSSSLLFAGLFKLQDLVKFPPSPKTEIYIRQAGPGSYRQVLREIRHKEIYKLIIDTDPIYMQQFFRAVSPLMCFNREVYIEVFSDLCTLRTSNFFLCFLFFYRRKIFNH